MVEDKNNSFHEIILLVNTIGISALLNRYCRLLSGRTRRCHRACAIQHLHHHLTAYIEAIGEHFKRSDSRQKFVVISILELLLNNNVKLLYFVTIFTLTTLHTYIR